MPVFKLHLVSDEDIVLRLLDDGLDETILITNHVRLDNVCSRPLTGAPVKGVTLADEPIESPTRLLHGCLIVGTMAENHINILQTQAF